MLKWDRNGATDAGESIAWSHIWVVSGAIGQRVYPSGGTPTRKDRLNRSATRRVGAMTGARGGLKCGRTNQNGAFPNGIQPWEKRR